MNNSTNQTATQQTKSFFDLHVRGIGYLNRVREVPVKKGPSYLSCTIAALRGAIGDVSYTKFDCNVVGEEAKKIVEQHMDLAETQKVLVGFKLGDPRMSDDDIFTYKSGAKAGQFGAIAKARLLLIDSVAIDTPPEQPLFDVDINGFGYLNHVREIAITSSHKMVVCTINALRGSVDDVEYTKFDCIVDSDVSEIILQHAVNSETHKVLIGFRLGDVKLDDKDIFTYKSGERAGKPGAVIKSTLKQVDWVKVNGELVFKRVSDEVTAPTEHIETAEQTTAAVEISSEDQQPIIGELPTDVEVSSNASNEAIESTAPVTEEQVFDDFVKLDKADPDFESKRTALKARGYRWDKSAGGWRKPETIAA